MEQLLGMVGDGAGIVLQIVVLAGLLLVWYMYKSQLKTAITSHTTAKKRQVLAQLGREAFAFAETVHAGQDGPSKLNEAVKFLLDRCDSCSLQNQDMKDVRAVIESAWLEDRRQSGRPIVLPVSRAQSEQR